VHTQRNDTHRPCPQIRAKGVLLRDLNELKAQKTSNNNLSEPRPVESQSKPPMTIDLDSSPPPAAKDQPIKAELSTKPVAPFPDMGMSLGDGPDADNAVKEEATPAAQVSPAAADGEQIKHEGEAASGTPSGGPTLADGHLNGADMLGANSGLNFTDMEFTLAPTNNDSQEQTGGDASTMNTTDPTFDLASFAPTAGADTTNLTSLDNMMSADLGGSSGAPTNEGKATDAKPGTEAPDAAYADIFGDGQADGMDFDFSIDGGMGGDTFDDMMNDRDNTFDPMEHGDFDANFFGLDKTDDA